MLVLSYKAAHLSAHVATGHVREDGLQHDVDGRGPLAQRGQDGEEAVAHRDGIQTPVEVLVLGQVKTAGTWKHRTNFLNRTFISDWDFRVFKSLLYWSTVV